MRVAVLFEDSVGSPISYLLTAVFGGDVKFCDTCDLFVKNIDEYLSRDYELIVCYFDTPPDNPKAIISRNKLCEHYENNGRVHVLKSQAIEHYVLRALVDSGDILRKSLLVDKFVQVQSCICVEYTDKTYEKFCKNVLNGNKRSCIRNVFNQDPSWYRIDCCAEGVKDECTARRYSIYQKRLMLMWALPYYPAYDKDKHLRELGYLTNTSVSEAERLCIEEFEKIKKSVCKGD